MHGLGADGHDFEPMVPWLKWPGAPAIRYVFPHAPVRPVTINGGMSMRAWYDILSLEGSREVDEEGITTSVRAATALIQREIERGIPAENIVVAGFSQGGAIATLAARGFTQRLGGLVVLSSYLLFGGQPGPVDKPSPSPEANSILPAFVAHGTLDPMLPIAMGREVATTLQELGHPVEWHEYPIAHSVSEEEIADVSAWLKQRLA